MVKRTYNNFERLKCKHGIQHGIRNFRRCKYGEGVDGTGICTLDYSEEE